MLVITEESVKSFLANNSFQHSAALAFYGLFALIPMLLLVIFILSSFITSSASAMKSVESISGTLLTGSGSVIINEVLAVSSHEGIWGYVSLFALFWAVMPLGNAIRSSFLVTFKVTEESPYLKSKLLDAVAVMLLLFLFIFIVISDLLYSKVASSFLIKYQFIYYASNILLPLFITTAFMSILFGVLLPHKLRLVEILPGAFITSLLLIAMRPAFTLFLSFNPKFGYAFGSLKAVFIILVWVYYSFLVILFGAEFIANTAKRQAIILKGLFLGSAVMSKRRMNIIKNFVRSYCADETIFNEGNAGNEMFFVLEGVVEIRKHGQVLKVIKEGEYFGEMSMLIDTPRTATAVSAQNGTRLVAVSENNFDIILAENSRIVMSILKEMARRLKSTSEHVES